MTILSRPDALTHQQRTIEDSMRRSERDHLTLLNMCLDLGIEEERLLFIRRLVETRKVSG